MGSPQSYGGTSHCSIIDAGDFGISNLRTSQSLGSLYSVVSHSYEDVHRYDQPSKHPTTEEDHHGLLNPISQPFLRPVNRSIAVSTYRYSYYHRIIVFSSRCRIEAWPNKASVHSPSSQASSRFLELLRQPVRPSSPWPASHPTCTGIALPLFGGPFTSTCCYTRPLPFSSQFDSTTANGVLRSIALCRPPSRFVSLAAAVRCILEVR